MAADNGIVGELNVAGNDNLLCSICMKGDSYSDNEIVFCDGCNVAVHQCCYNIQTVPEFEWYCDVCEQGKRNSQFDSVARITMNPACQLCYQTGGALRPTTVADVWVHVQCASWIPEIDTWQQDEKYDLSNLNQQRYNLKCFRCKIADRKTKSYGACVQCKYKRCCTSVHPCCALMEDSGCIHRVRRDKKGFAVWEIFCPLHAQAAAAEEAVVPIAEIPQLTSTHNEDKGNTTSDIMEALADNLPFLSDKLSDSIESSRSWRDSSYSVTDSRNDHSSSAPYGYLKNGKARKHPCPTPTKCETLQSIVGDSDDMWVDEAAADQQLAPLPLLNINRTYSFAIDTIRSPVVSGREAEGEDELDDNPDYTKDYTVDTAGATDAGDVALIPPYGYLKNGLARTHHCPTPIADRDIDVSDLSPSRISFVSTTASAARVASPLNSTPDHGSVSPLLADVGDNCTLNQRSSMDSAPKSPEWLLMVVDLCKLSSKPLKPTAIWSTMKRYGWSCMWNRKSKTIQPEKQVLYYRQYEGRHVRCISHFEKYQFTFGVDYFDDLRHLVAFVLKEASFWGYEQSSQITAEVAALDAPITTESTSRLDGSMKPLSTASTSASLSISCSNENKESTKKTEPSGIDSDYKTPENSLPSLKFDWKKHSDVEFILCNQCAYAFTPRGSFVCLKCNAYCCCVCATFVPSSDYKDHIFTHKHRKYSFTPFWRISPSHYRGSSAVDQVEHNGDELVEDCNDTVQGNDDTHESGAEEEIQRHKYARINVLEGSPTSGKFLKAKPASPKRKTPVVKSASSPRTSYADQTLPNCNGQIIKLNDFVYYKTAKTLNQWQGSVVRVSADGLKITVKDRGYTETISIDLASTDIVKYPLYGHANRARKAVKPFHFSHK